MDQVVEIARLKKSKIVLISKTRSDDGKKHYELQWIVRDFHQLHLNTLYNGPHIQIGNDVSQFQLYTSYMGPMELTTEKFVLLGLSPDPEWAEVESMVVVGTPGLEATPLSLDSGRLAYALDLPDRFSYHGFEVEDNTKDLVVIVVLVTGQQDKGNFLRTLERVEERCTLAENMGELLRKEIYSDLVIVAGKKQFNVHKSILHARSESFAALLEKHPHHTTLKLETDSEATEEILYHIYTHKTKPYDVNMTIKLLPLASDFGLKDLKMFLRDHLADILTPERALKMAVEYNQSGKNDIRDCAIESIGNRLEEAMELLEWDRFARFHAAKPAYLSTAHKTISKVDPMDLDFGELEVKGIHRDNNDFKVYYLQWSIRDYPRLKPNKKYKAHHIVLGSKVLKIIVSRQEQSNILIIKVVPYPKFSTISFTMVSPDGTEYDAFFKDTIRDIQYSSFYVSSTDLVTVRMEVTTSSVLSLFKSVDAPTNLSSQLETLLSSGQHSDAQVAAGGVTIPVHRGILAARCPLLDGKMIIDNADKESVQELLNYLYTGRTKDLHQDLAYSLFQLSHQYRLSGLVEQVAVYLERNMNPQDVLRTLVLADVYGHQGLRKRAIDFVVRHTNAVMYREDWGPFSLNHPVILNEILQGVSEYCLQSKITVQGTAYKEDEDPTA